ncbi:DnaJ domain-containing protein [Frigoribacterium sp. 2-23]|uniref:DnaJ domain-containing protein n=1 Tax=Frigoribacterium sp. 2-23 TaxID=3415006 RepID=UPI003C6EF5EA
MTPSPASATPYEVLGVPATASDDELRRAYRRLAREAHPDLGGSAESFRRLQQAWDAIGTPEARAAYDRGRSSTGSASPTGTARAGGGTDPGWAPPARDPQRTDSKPRARVHGHPGGANRERYLSLMREWVGRGVPVDDPYDERLVRSAPPEIRHVLADAMAEEATVAIVTDLGIGYTIWSDVDAGPEGKLDHIVLGPSGLFAIQSSDWGSEVAITRGELVGDGIPVGEEPVRELTRQARAVRRETRVPFTAQLIVVPDDDFAPALEQAGRGRKGATFVVRRSLLPQVLRHGPGLDERTSISDVFEVRARLQQTIRFV